MFNGEVRIEETDLQSTGFGQPWNHTRSYSNQMQETFDRGNGYNWNLNDWPYLVESNLPGNPVIMMGSSYEQYWFHYDSVLDKYVSLYGGLTSLNWDQVNGIVTFVELDGTILKFNDLGHPVRPGNFIGRILPGGEELTVDDSNAPTELEATQQYTVDNTTVYESFYYELHPPTAQNVGRIYRVTLRRKVDNGPWENVRKAEYLYSNENSLGSSSSSVGDRGDLSLVTRYEFYDGVWEELDKTYYRWYGGSLASQHLLQFVVGPQAYQNMLAASLNPQSASDAQLALYADNQFVYGENNRVVKEIVDGGSRTYLMSYVDRSELASSSSSGGGGGGTDPIDYNEWYRKSTLTYPDGKQQIVYCNAAGQTMLEIIKKGDDEWLNFTRYDEDARVILEASPEAINGFDEELPDLMGYDSGTEDFTYLNNTEGLITVREYFTSTAGNGAPGYPKSEKIKNGQNGTEVKTHEWEYDEHTASGMTIYKVSVDRQFTDTLGTEIETFYWYTYFSGTNQVYRKTTKRPVVPNTQNGPGTAVVTSQIFDEFGNLRWETDERDIITGYRLDIATGALTQLIEDVDPLTTPGCPYITTGGDGLSLKTDFEHDINGRITQSLGPVHQVDLNGTATNVRTATWTVYKDHEFTTISAQGYQVVTGAQDFLVNPVSITRRNKVNLPTDEILAVRSSTTGKLEPTDSFPQSSYRQWMTKQYTDCCRLASTRTYHTIPASGEGVSGTNYDQTSFGYDANGLQNQTTTPGGTITETTFDPRDLPLLTKVGTAPINMVTVTENQYDNGTDGGNGNLTKLINYTEGALKRETSFTYDFRSRRLSANGELDFYEEYTYDNLDRRLTVKQYDTDSSGNLVAYSEADYDNRSRVYRTTVHEVDPSTGTVGNALVSNVWYDQPGNVIKSQPAGSDLFTKTVYDSLYRVTATYLGYDLDESTYSEATTISGDTIVEQTEQVYDDGSNLLKTIARQRYHNATGTGALQGPTGTQPLARVSYQAAWPSPVGRVQATANYGTNGGSGLTRPATIPTASDSILVSSTSYDDVGQVEARTDPAGKVDKFEYDDAGRRTKLIENYVESSSSSSSSSGDCPGSADTNRTTTMTYTPDGQIATLNAWNGDTGIQTTSYTYGTTLVESAIETSLLLRKVTYPDSSSGSDVVSYTYNRQGQRTSMTDQAGTVHAYDYDGLGRFLNDRVTTLGTGVDPWVRSMARTYDVRGLLTSVWCTSSPAPGAGVSRNEIEWQYNGFGQVSRSRQEPTRTVATATPEVQYGYADGSANTIRPETITYPNGRELTYNYGTTNGMNDAMSRVEEIVDDDSTVLTAEEYLGLSSIVESNRPQRQFKFTLASLTGSTDPDTGDIYTGLDRFGRVKDCRWYDTANSVDLDRYEYGYDRVGNRLYRKNVLAHAA
ncbi:RHS repeat domain-containing protein, partial [Thalassoglobus neptunius]|uniref:RHS repeat domain-containing protein n=1 Tax=Thalassoglobus neptunius TaxID=1938619 RepID=UPI0018D23596